jgi:hypothetical protein
MQLGEGADLGASRARSWFVVFMFYTKRRSILLGPQAPT